MPKVTVSKNAAPRAEYSPKPGEIFLFNDRAYMMLNEPVMKRNSQANAICLEDARPCYFGFPGCAAFDSVEFEFFKTWELIVKVSK